MGTLKNLIFIQDKGVCWSACKLDPFQHQKTDLFTFGHCNIFLKKNTLL